MRILFVAFPDSIHTARWITQLTDQGWDIHLVPSTPNRLHPLLKGKVTVHAPAYRVRRLWHGLATLLAHWPHHRGSGHARRLAAKLTAAPVDRVVRGIQPDMVHSLEIQHAGYMTHDAKKRMGDAFPPWIITNWGSDVYLFGKLNEHRERVRGVLRDCDYYISECERDVALAQEMGLQGKPLMVLPCGGGFNLDYTSQFRQPGKVSDRRLIIVKGYQHWAGRGLVGLRAVEMCADLLKEKGYRVVMPLSPPDVRVAAEMVTYNTGLEIEIPVHGPYEDALRRFGAARIHIGLSISDAISQSLLESMVMGAFPIQSFTACADEWIQDGKTGILVPPNDPHIVAEALRKAVLDDELVNEAAVCNWEVAQKRLAYDVIKPQAVDIYERVYEEAASSS